MSALKIPDPTAVSSHMVQTLAGASGHRYQLDATLTDGGQATIWAARRCRDGAPVVLKVASGQPEAIAAVREEAEVLDELTRAQSRGIIRLLDRSWLGQRPVLVLGRYRETAETFVPRLQKQEGVAGVLRFTARIARGLAAMHGLRPSTTLIHRDIKPDNILVDHLGRGCLADFGGALFVDEPVRRRSVFGSPLWAPLDQVLPEVSDANPTWDTTALCQCLFYWLTKRRTAIQENPQQVLTPRGQQVWSALCAVTQAQTATQRKEAHRHLSRARQGTTDHDLFHFRGVGSLSARDQQRVRRLGPNTEALEALLMRALSPVAYPSPPNRFWDAGELALQLDQLAAGFDPMGVRIR